MAELYAASNQWATRPADERFWTLQEMRDQCYDYYIRRTEHQSMLNELHFDHNDGELFIRADGGTPMKMTNWGFKQLCGDLGAPATYVGSLPAELCQQVMNHHVRQYPVSRNPVQIIGLKHKTKEKEVFRFYNTPTYTRIWNYQICDQLLEVTRHDKGWRVPPARPMNIAGPTKVATRQDVLKGKDNGLSINVGDHIGPAGLYASDHDMFAFLVNEEHRIPDGTDAGLARGIFISNYEVPGYAFKVWRFLYRYVCGNHIVWGAENVATFRIIHVNVSFQLAWEAMSRELQGWLDRSSKEDADKIKRLQTYKLGDDLEEVCDKIYAFRFGITRKQLEGAYEKVNLETFHEDGDPRTPWGMVNGLTRLSQESPYADERTKLETAVGRLMMVNS